MDFEKSVDFEKLLILKKCGFHILIQNLRVSAAGVALPPPHDSVNLSHRCLKGNNFFKRKLYFKRKLFLKENIFQAKIVREQKRDNNNLELGRSTFLDSCIICSIL